MKEKVMMNTQNNLDLTIAQATRQVNLTLEEVRYLIRLGRVEVYKDRQWQRFSPEQFAHLRNLADDKSEMFLLYLKLDEDQQMHFWKCLQKKKEFQSTSSENTSDLRGVWWKKVDGIAMFYVGIVLSFFSEALGKILEVGGLVIIMILLLSLLTFYLRQNWKHFLQGRGVRDP